MPPRRGSPSVASGTSTRSSASAAIEARIPMAQLSPAAVSPSRRAGRDVGADPTMLANVRVASVRLGSQIVRRDIGS